MTIGEKIRYFAEKKYSGRGSLTKLSEELEMNPSGLQAYIADKRAPGTPLLKKLHKLGCDLNWLIGDETDINEVDDKDVEYIELRKQVDTLSKRLDELVNKKSGL